MNAAKLIEEVCHVFEELLRVRQLVADAIARGEKLSDITDEEFSQMPAPEGYGHYALSESASRAIKNIVAYGMKNTGLEEVVTEETFERNLKKILSRKFLGEGLPPNQKHVSRAIGEAGRKCYKLLSNHIHIIPIRFISHNTPKCFKVGSITFINRSEFELFVEHISADVQYEKKHDENPEYLDYFLNSSLDYYRTFKWFACVEIDPAEDAISWEVAEECVKDSLSFLQVLFREYYSEKFEVGGVSITKDNRAKISLRDGRFYPSLSSEGVENGGFSEGWEKKYLYAEDVSELIGYAGKIIDLKCRFQKRNIIARRLNAAIDWFSQGVTEASDAAAIVKYVTGLETLFLPSETSGISAVLSERLAAFCHFPDEIGSYQKAVQDAEALYDLRSRAVHGDLIPSRRKEFANGRYKTSEMSRVAIIQFMRAVGERGLTDADVGKGRYEGYLNRYTEFMKRYVHNPNLES